MIAVNSHEFRPVAEFLFEQTGLDAGDFLETDEDGNQHLDLTSTRLLVATMNDEAEAADEGEQDGGSR